MASSDNLASMEPWAFQRTFADSWISEAFARDTDTLTKALQKSLSNQNHHSGESADHHHAAGDGGVVAAMASFFSTPPENPMAAIRTQFNGGGGSGSDPETPVSAAAKGRVSIPVNGGGKAATKRKSRASKRSTTTFITADPANFRQMVQQVTGVRFAGAGSPQVPVPMLLKPEPQRPSVGRLMQGQGCLPTLDTSAFLLDHHHVHRQQQALPPSSTSSAAQPPLPAVSTPDFAVFDSFSSFPTLESCSF